MVIQEEKMFSSSDTSKQLVRYTDILGNAWQTFVWASLCCTKYVCNKLLN